MTHIYKPKRFKKLRKTLAIAAACAAALCALPPSTLAWGEDVKVVVNNNLVTFADGATAYLDNDTTMIPLRAVAEAMDATVYWFEEEQRIQIIKYDKVLSIALGIWVMGEYTIDNGVTTFVRDIDLPVPAVQHGADRGYCTYIPLRIIVESLGGYVKWNDDSQTAYITTDSGYKKWYNEVNVGDLPRMGNLYLFKTTGEVLMIDSVPYLWDGNDFNTKIQITEAGGDIWYSFFPDRNFASVKVELSAVTALGESGEVVIPLRRSSTSIKLLNSPTYDRTWYPAYNIGGTVISNELLTVNFFYGYWNSNGGAEFNARPKTTYRYDYILNNEYMGGGTVKSGQNNGSIGCNISALDENPQTLYLKLYAQESGKGMSQPTVCELKLWRNESIRTVYLQLPYGEVREIAY